MLASNFGASSSASGIFNLDTYYAAFRLPDLLFNLLSYGILSSAFVPIFVEILKRENKEAAFKFANEILHAIGTGILVLSGVLFVFTPFLIKLFVPGFGEIDFQTTINLTRLMLVTPFLFTIGSVAGGIQNSLHKFLGIALAPALYNLGIIGGIVFFSHNFGVYGVAIGVIIGAFLNVFSQLAGLLKTGFSYMWPRKWFTPRVKEMIKLSLPRIFGMSVTQISLIVDTIIASTLATGSIAIVNFASNLESLPIGIIGISVAIVSFGMLAEYAAEGKIEELANELSVNIRRILFFLMPLGFGMLALRFQIVRLLLGRGKFNWTDTILTANTLGVFLSGLIFGGIVFSLARGFYALKDTKTPVLIGIISVIANIVCVFIFTKILGLGTYGLAAANSFADIINASLLIILLSKRLKRPLLNFSEIAKFIIASLIMTIFIQIAKLQFANIFSDIDTYLELTIQTVAASIVGIAVYFGVCTALKCKDSKEIIKKLTAYSERIK